MPDRKIVAACKRAAIAAGYYLREGAYVGTADDVAGTWYVVHENDDFFRPYGRGHGTQSAAWLAANKEAEYAENRHWAESAAERNFGA